ncbi:unnamed protein product, partial [marine sediment metagenome]
MKGNILYSLNALRIMYPDIYKKVVKKYEWRKYLLSLKLPLGNYYWNDVIHCLPMTPSIVYNALKEAGEIYP